MRIPTVIRLVFMYLALWLFALVSAAAIAETEIVKEYRPMVYWGVCLGLVALGLLVCGIWLFLLHRVHQRIHRCSKFSSEERISALQAMLKKYRSASFRSVISLELVEAYLQADQNESAFSLLALILPKGSLYFDHKTYRSLLAICAVRKNTRELYRFCGAVKVNPKEYPFLSPEEVLRLKDWQK